MFETEKITKEQLREVHFRNSNAGISFDELRNQQRKLQLSILLSKQANAMVKIIFNTIDGYKEVKASVWGATEKYILLTGGNFIPVEAVASVTLD